MNRCPRRLQRKAPPLRGRAASLSSLDHNNFAPLSARPIVRQSPPRPLSSPRLRPQAAFNQPDLDVQSGSNGYDSTYQEPIKPPPQPESGSRPVLKPVSQWTVWGKRWGWFVALTLLIMAIAIVTQR